MNRIEALHLVQTMIDYFEAGNRQTDAVAKDIIESDPEYLNRWQAEIKRRKDEGEWTGLRAPEADIVADSLRAVQELIAYPPC